MPVRAPHSPQHAVLVRSHRQLNAATRSLAFKVAISIPVAFGPARVIVDSVFVFASCEDDHKVRTVEFTVEIRISVPVP